MKVRWHSSRYIDTGELRLHAVIGGEGPPLLLVHGGPETSYAWCLMMPALAQDFEVIAGDQRGMGRPPSQRAGTTPAPSWSAVRGSTMTRADDWVVVEVAGSEPEAELLCSLLRSAGIECVPRLTNRGAGAGDGVGTVGPYDIVVSPRDAHDARELLHGPR
jgi:pimeloyl-ACP methyl ester carboxylesterase